MDVRVVGASLLLLMLTGCGTEPDASATGEGAPGAVGSPEAEVAVHGLTCSTDARSGGTLDFNDEGGAATPKAAAREMAGAAEGVAVQQESEEAAVAYLLRADDTAYMRLDLVTLSDGTWRVNTFDACPGEGPGN